MCILCSRWYFFYPDKILSCISSAFRTSFHRSDQPGSRCTYFGHIGVDTSLFRIFCSRSDLPNAGSVLLGTICTPFQHLATLGIYRENNGCIESVQRHSATFPLHTWCNAFALFCPGADQGCTCDTCGRYSWRLCRIPRICLRHTLRSTLSWPCIAPADKKCSTPPRDRSTFDICSEFCFLKDWSRVRRSGCSRSRCSPRHFAHCYI